MLRSHHTQRHTQMHPHMLSHWECEELWSHMFCNIQVICARSQSSYYLIIPVICTYIWLCHSKEPQWSHILTLSDVWYLTNKRCFTLQELRTFSGTMCVYPRNMVGICLTLKTGLLKTPACCLHDNSGTVFHPEGRFQKSCVLGQLKRCFCVRGQTQQYRPFTLKLMSCKRGLCLCVLL